MDEKELQACKKEDKVWMCPIADCGKTLSRKQTLQSHLLSSHNIRAGNPSKRYKLYEESEEVPIPKSTIYYRQNLKETESLLESAPSPCQSYVIQPNSSDLDHSNEIYQEPNETNDSSPEDEEMEIEEELVTNFIESYGPPLFMIPPTDQGYNAPISQYHHYMAISAFATYHNLSDRGFGHLIELLGLHLPKENLMEYNIDTLKELCGFEDSFLSQHLFCSVCKKLFTREENCKTPGCNGSKDKKTNYFVTGNIETQLKEVLERTGIWASLQEYSKQRSHTTISDIVDGEEYKKLRDGFLSNSNNITLSLFTDGIPLFQSSKVSLWPVYLIINELPPKLRFSRKNMVLWGVWQGCGKPQMNMFLRPLVEDLIHLYRTGMELCIDNILAVCRVMLIVATMDLQARAYVLQMTQHNGEYGCLYCLEPGVVVKSGKGTCRSYKYSETPATSRTKEMMKDDAKAAVTSGKKVRGVIANSVLSCLPYFDPTSNIVIDYMHGILLGIMKKLMGLWFDGKSNGKPYYIGHKVDEIDKVVKTIMPPYYIRRLPRKIAGNFHHWKASEFRSWLLYYSLPALKDHLPELYLSHYSLLVEGTSVLLGEGISTVDLNRADLLLKTFVKMIEPLYCENVIGLNVHNLLHLPRCVKNWGPLWAWSCFVFESFNGEIKKTIHGTGNACRQIFWSLQCQKKIEALAIDCEDSRLKKFYQSMTEGNNVRQKGGEEAYQCSVFTPAKVTIQPSNIVQQKLAILCDGYCTDEYKLIKKISRNGFLMFSKLCTRVIKRNSYTIRTKDGKMIEVEYFLMKKSSRKVFAVCRELLPQGPLLKGRVPHLQSFSVSRPQETVVPVDHLLEPVVVVKRQTSICCGRIPNNTERD